MLFRANDWATREDTWRSYELFARYVMPRFQGSLDTIQASYDWTKANRSTIFSPNVGALKKAFDDAGRAPPAEFAARSLGALDAKPEGTS